MNFFKRLFGKKPNRPAPQNPNRRHVSDVKAGELVLIEWDRIKDKVGYLTCVNNDPDVEKILLKVTWNNYQQMGRSNPDELVVFDYDSQELANFNLLNPVAKFQSDMDNETDILSLQKKFFDAMEKGDNEQADILQKKIDKLLKK